MIDTKPTLLALLAIAGCTQQSGAIEASQVAHAAEPAASAYDPLQAFAPLTLPAPANLYRAADGTPGPEYWQNRADYTIRASLDPRSALLSGSEVITYTNNSPQALASLWLQLDQNIYRKDARARYVHASSRRSLDERTDGNVLESVQLEEAGRLIKADYVVSDTRMQIRLTHPLVPRGGKLEIHIQYHFTVPGAFGGRTGHIRTRNGEIFDVAQWYPRMAVYDDVRGWDTLPYLGAEFYLEYGNFDYYVTVPRGMVVAGSGELENPAEVLTALERQRLQQARGSDRTVMIRTAEEIASPQTASAAATATWHFRIDQARDVSFAASRAFIWDAARFKLPGGRSGLAMSFYPIESAGSQAWGRVTEYVKYSLEQFSRRWGFDYPYPTAAAVAGPIGGMEYPAIVFDDYTDRGKDLFALTAHEFGHTWFPMVVGFDERRDQWMDEGFNTFIDIYESEDFQHGTFGPKRDPEYAPGGGNPADEILPTLEDPAAPTLLTRADQVAEKYRHPVTYFKSALGLALLREQILGPNRFDWAFRKFISDWAYRHPKPSDFFRAMESAAGEDLSWFWRGWYMHNWTFDLAVQGVHPVRGGWSKGAVIGIANLDRLVLPAVVRLDFRDGSSERIQLPAETWIQQKEVDLTVDTTQPIESVTIDPDRVLPDKNRSNNAWKAAPGA